MKTSQRRYSVEELKAYLASLGDPSIEDCPEDLEDLERLDDCPLDSSKPAEYTKISHSTGLFVLNKTVRQLLQEKKVSIGRNEFLELDMWQIELCNPSYKPERRIH